MPRREQDETAERLLTGISLDPRLGKQHDLNSFTLCELARAFLSKRHSAQGLR
ncbi:hypothetical protein [Teredinibacter haidensis]|uniref:hypothetical protein n=1 Tax=Teredinibacter haidensis TaxID=2731755 RepID=UPI000B05A290|nr:hypothetical protein [Teredinibacter haidensis]